MMGWARWRTMRSLRLRTLLIVVAAIAIGLGVYQDRQRRLRIREMLKHAMINAAEAGDTEKLRRLMDRGADVDSVTNGRFPWTPLMEASFRGHLDAVRLLVDRGANLDHQDLDFLSSITLAAREGHWNIVQILLDHGADTTLSDAYSKTVLDYAREQKAGCDD